MSPPKKRTQPRTKGSDLAATIGIEYLTALPNEVPPGYILVHNQVTPTRQLGMGGFQAWLSRRGETHHRYEPCSCGFAPELGEHYCIVKGNS